MNPASAARNADASSITPLGGIYLRLVLTTAFWGGTFIAGRYLAQGMPHFSAATLRFLFALLGLVIFQRFSGSATSAPLTRRQHLAIFALGATGIFAYNAGFFASLGRIPASRVALMVAASPILTLVAVQLIERGRWSFQLVGGVALSFVGVLLIVSHGDLPSLLHGALGLGELYFFGAVVAWVAYTLVIRYFLRGVPALTMTLGAAAWGVLLLGVPALWELANGELAWPSAGQWAALAYLGLCGTTLSFVWYNRAVGVIGAARATQFTNLVPVFGVLLSVLLLGETLPLSGMLGGLMVIAGVLVANRRP